MANGVRSSIFLGGGVGSVAGGMSLLKDASTVSRSTSNGIQLCLEPSGVITQ